MLLTIFYKEIKRSIVLFLVFFTIPSFAQIIEVFDTKGSYLSEVQITDGQTIITTDSIGKADISLFKYSDLFFYKEGFFSFIISWENLQKRNFKVVLKEKNFDIETVVIAANKWEQPVSQVSVSIVALSLENLISFMPQTMADFLGTTDKIYIQKSQFGGGSPMLRGFAANRVLIVVDGIRMNNAIFRGGNLHNVISLEPLIVDKSEIILGPASNLYGSDALGGVMDFHTKLPTFSQDKLQFNSLAAMSFWSADMATKIHYDFTLSTRNWASLTSITFSVYNDRRMGVKGPDEYLRDFYVAFTDSADIVVDNINPLIQVPSGFGQIYFMQKFRVRIGKNKDITFSSHYSSTTNIPRYDRLILLENSLPIYATWFYGPQKWIMNHILFTNKVHTKFSDYFRLVFAYQDYKESRHDRKLNDSLQRNRQEHVLAYSVNMDIFKNLASNKTLFYGTEMVINRVFSFANLQNIKTGSISELPTRYPNGAEYYTNAYYIQLKSKFAQERLILNTGLRYTHLWLLADFDTSFYNFSFDKINLNTGAFSGSLGIIYKFNPGFSYTFNFSSGFRAPNIDDIGKVFDSEPGKVIVPNPHLKPEYAYTLDNGLRVNKNKFYGNFNIFCTYLDNAIVRGDFRFNGQDSIIYDGVMSKVQALVNTDYAILYGSEIEFKFLLIKGLTFENYLVYYLGRDSKGNSLRHIPPLYGSSHLKFKNKKYFIDFFIRFNGEIPYKRLAPSEKDKPHLYAIDKFGNPYYPAWWTLNFSVKRKLENLIIYANIENILDKRYRPYSSGITERGKSLNFGFMHHF